MLPNLGLGELIVILVIVVILFGAKRLPEIAKGIGSSVKTLKDAMREDHPAEAPPPVKPPEKPL